MFSGSILLEKLDISKFNTGKVENMAFMFDDCSSLRSLDISSFDTSNVTDMRGMFVDMHYITLDVSHFITTKVTDMSYMFDTIYNGINVIGWENFDTSNVTEYEDFFPSNQSDSWKQYFQ